jgi:hypothetical protein
VFFHGNFFLKRLFLLSAVLWQISVGHMFLTSYIVAAIKRKCVSLIKKCNTPGKLTDINKYQSGSSELIGATSCSPSNN